MAGFDKAKQDSNNNVSLLGVTSSGAVRAVLTDEDGNLSVSVNEVILTSPDGTLYKLVVDNSGNLSTSAV